jgi:hypothetical protein
MGALQLPNLGLLRFARSAMSSGSARPIGGVLRFRTTLVEDIRRTEDPARCERLERQQVPARLGRLFGDSANPLEAMFEYARTLKKALPESDR